MTMAAAPTPSRPLTIADKPRTPAASRTSLSRYSSRASLNERGNQHTPSSSMGGIMAGQPSAHYCRSASSSRCQSLIAQNVPQLDIGHSRLTRSLSRSSWSAGTAINSIANRRPASCSVSEAGTMRNRKVKRWAQRTTAQWDGLRRDPDLWFEDGDCYVYTYARGQSRRQASFCVPFRTLREKQCGAMFSLCFAQTTSPTGLSSSIPSRASSGYSTPTTKANAVELYIPAPEDWSITSRENSYRWHIATRNFFAWILDKPLVGEHLGQSLIDLQERMHLFRSGRVNNYEDVMSYVDRMGYSDFVDCPDYALAMLSFAEHYKIRDLWIDSFAHCVGMNERLSLSDEFGPISRLTKALITRAYLEMDIHLGRVSAVLRNFLEDDFSSAYFGLSDSGRAHLDKFRSFLHSFYVEKFGYWPPPQGVTFPRALYKALHHDFKNLYDFLKDEESSSDISTQKPASGGICVLQNVDAFNNRHNFTPLPHPLPLLPQEPSMQKTQSQRTLRTLTLGSKQDKTKVDKYLTASTALAAATNDRDALITSCPLVQAFVRFERDCALNRRQEKIPMVESRRIRWIMIYGILQYLTSGTRAPQEVRDTERPDYPLCCLISEQVPWQIGARFANDPAPAPVNVPEAINSYLSETGYHSVGQTTPQIQPDCQSDDYFTHTNRDAPSRAVSVEIPAPLRISSPLARVTSGRSLKRLSLSTRSSRRNSVSKAPSQSFCEILVHGYGNGLNEAIVDPPSQGVSRSGSVGSAVVPDGVLFATTVTETSTVCSPFNNAPHISKRTSTLSIRCDLSRERSRTPCLDSQEMDQLVSPVRTSAAPSSSNSSCSTESPPWSDGDSSNSSQSSTHEVPLHRRNSTAEAESSGLLGGNVPIASSVVGASIVTPKRKTSRSSSKNASPATPSARHGFRFSFENNTAGVFGFPSVTESSPSVTDTTIGVALSKSPSFTSPAPPPPAIGALSFETVPVVKKKTSRPMSYIPKGARSPPPVEQSVVTEAPRKAGGGIDIFSALSLGPSRPEEQAPVKTVTESSRPTKPSRNARSLYQPPEFDLAAVVAEAEKARKKDRRRSFWRR